MVLDGKGLEITSYVVVFVYYTLLYQRLHEIQVYTRATVPCLLLIVDLVFFFRMDSGMDFVV